MRKGTRHSQATREKQREKAREIAARRRQIRAVAPADVERLERQGDIAPSLRPFARQATETTAALVHALGGPDAVSPQQLQLAQDVGREDLLIRACMARLLASEAFDLDLLSKVTSLFNARRSTLAALGLHRVQRDALDVEGYATALNAQTRAQPTNGADPDAQDLDDVEDTPTPSSASGSAA